MTNEYLAETQLRALSPRLHQQYTNCIVVSTQLLTRYQSLFADYTDHSNLHALLIVDFCNRLIGDQIHALTEADLYVLLMGALFHDVGMGISEKDLYAYMEQVHPLEAASMTPDTMQDTVRRYHHDISAWFVWKYRELLEIPGDSYARAIMQVCRGHRKVDLMDLQEYPRQFALEDGRSVSLPYLAALIRLADELDIAADRNIAFLYDPDAPRNAASFMEFQKHRRIRPVQLLPDRILVQAKTRDPAIRERIIDTVKKLAGVLEECRQVTEAHSCFTIHQSRVELCINEQPIPL